MLNMKLVKILLHYFYNLSLFEYNLVNQLFLLNTSHICIRKIFWIKELEILLYLLRKILKFEDFHH